MSQIDFRSSPRAVLTGRVRYWEWDRVRSADSVEVSSGGIFLRTPEPLPEGAHLTLRLELPGGPGMTVLGRVVRTVKGGVVRVAGMGVRFLDLLPSQRQAIQRFVESRAVPAETV